MYFTNRPTETVYNIALQISRAASINTARQSSLDHTTTRILSTAQPQNPGIEEVLCIVMALVHCTAQNYSCCLN